MEVEKERFVVLGFALVLMLIFVSYLGPVITGNVVKDVAAVSLADFPYPFIKNGLLNNVVIVVDDHPSSDALLAAQELAEFFDFILDVYPEIRVASKVGLKPMHQIIVGEQCTQVVIRVLGSAACTAERGSGWLVLGTDGATMRLVVSGADSRGVRRAVKLLALYKVHPLSGSEVSVEEGRSGQVLVR